MRSLVFVCCAVAACSTDPVGGRGPFDPVYDPVPETFNPVITSPAGPTPAAEGSNTDDVFRSEIEAALNGDPSAGTRDPVVTTADGTGALPGASEIGIDPNAQEINLSLSSQEEQKVQREAAARRLEAARAQRVEIAPEALPQQNNNANVVKFARATTHPVGKRLYRRNPLISRSQSRQTCRRFDSPDDAQRQFLARGGPEQDPFNLDPDGDGFACQFDPEIYRKLTF